MTTEIHLTEIDIKRIIAKSFNVNEDNVEIKEMKGTRGYPYIGAIVKKDGGMNISPITEMVIIIMVTTTHQELVSFVLLPLN